MIKACLRSAKAPLATACAMLFGYATGTLVILAVLSASFDRRKSVTKPWDIFANNMLFWRYKFEGFDEPYFDTVHYSVTASILFVLGVVFASRGHVWWTPVWLAPPVIRRAEGTDRVRTRRVWKCAMRSQRLTARLGVLFLITMVGTWFCFGIDGLIMQIRERMWMRNPMANPWFNATPRPVIGWMTWADAVWITGVIVWADLLRSARGARRRVLRSCFVAKRWCRRCGYPLTRAGHLAPACSECGPGP